MKKYCFLLTLICCSEVIVAQDCKSDFLGTKTLYTFSPQNYTAAPAGYSPIFINHVGRHGARHLTKDVKTEFSYSLLNRADSSNSLTAEGKKLWTMVQNLQKVEKGNTKSISAEGKAELKGIGERMSNSFRPVFAGEPGLNVGITKEIRTKQSADAFLAGLSVKWKKAPAVNEYNDDTDLRFYDASPEYRKFEKSDLVAHNLEELRRVNNIAAVNSNLTAKFFIENFVTTLSDDERSDFVADLLGYATIVYSLKEEIETGGFKTTDLDFAAFFSCDQLAKLAVVASAGEDLQKGPGVNVNGIQIRVAVPLLINFIKTSDEFINGGKYNAQLRFAHAETIAPFAALLGLATADIPAADSKMIAKVWKASAVIPLSANIQWIFYKKEGSNDYLVKLMLNEKEEAVTGLLPVAKHYYSWKTLRAFYINRLKQFNVGLDDDMNKYLFDLR